MLDTLKQMIASQYEASLCTLSTCIDRCPESAWHLPIGIYEFSQVAFHTLFFADCYLGPNRESLRQQPFHLENKAFFNDYEQLEARKPVGIYDRPALQKYMRHCRGKAADAVASATADSLRAHSGFRWRDCSRAELHVYNIRHIQHHAAQLILRLRTETGVDVPWFGSGWREV
jgi:hypothetical protein